jgi:hypothetical protein
MFVVATRVFGVHDALACITRTDRLLVWPAYWCDTLTANGDSSLDRFDCTAVLGEVTELIPVDTAINLPRSFYKECTSTGFVLATGRSSGSLPPAVGRMADPHPCHERRH